jgi:hypothetical protein
MSSNTGIPEKISDYLAGKVDASELGQWISIETWDIENEPPATRQLGYDVLRLLSEASNGEWTDQELRVQLAKLCGIVTDTPSLRAEGFLEKLSVAEESREQAPKREEDQLAAVMRYAHLASPMAASSETAQPSDREFLHQPTAESETRRQAPKELAIG